MTDTSPLASSSSSSPQRCVGFSLSAHSCGDFSTVVCVVWLVPPAVLIPLCPVASARRSVLQPSKCVMPASRTRSQPARKSLSTTWSSAVGSKPSPLLQWEHAKKKKLNMGHAHHKLYDHITMTSKCSAGCTVQTVADKSSYPEVKHTPMHVDIKNKYI